MCLACQLRSSGTQTPLDGTDQRLSRFLWLAERSRGSPSRGSGRVPPAWPVHIEPRDSLLRTRHAHAFPHLPHLPGLGVRSYTQILGYASVRTVSHVRAQPCPKDSDLDRGWEAERLSGIPQDEMIGPDARTVPACVMHIHFVGDRSVRHLPSESMRWDHLTTMTRDLDTELTVAVDSRPNPRPAIRPNPYHGLEPLDCCSGEVGCTFHPVNDELMVWLHTSKVAALGPKQARGQ